MVSLAGCFGKRSTHISSDLREHFGVDIFTIHTNMDKCKGFSFLFFFLFMVVHSQQCLLGLLRLYFNTTQVVNPQV